MKCFRLPHAIFLSSMAVSLGLVSQLSAQTWNQTAVGASYLWSLGTNWDTGTAPNLAGAVANVNNNIVGNQTIALPTGTTTLGTLNLGDSDGTNTFTIGSNNLTFSSATAGGATALNVSATGTLINAINSSVTLGGTSPLTVTNLGTQRLQFGGALDVGTNTLTLNTSNTTAGSIGIGSSFTGTGALIKNGQGNVTLTSNASYSGTVTVNTGSFSVAGGATNQIGTLAFTVNANSVTGNSPGGGGSVLVVGSNQSPNPTGRINDAAVITLNGGGFTYLASNATGLTSETIGSLVVGSGNSNLTISVGNGTTPESEIHMTTLSRPGNGTLQVRGNLLGSASGTASSTRIIIDTTPTLIGGGGGAGTTTMSILPWANGGTNVSNEAAGLVTYDGANGLRNLASGEYTTLALATATSNVSSGIVGLAADKTINALAFTNGSIQNIGVGMKLTITSGALLFSNNGGIATGTLDFGNEGVIFSINRNANTISSAITGSSGITKGGTGDLTLSAAAGSNTYSGTTTVSGGILKMGAVNTLPSGTAVVLANSTVNTLTTGFVAVTTSLDLNGFSQTIGSLAGGGTFGGNVLLGSGNLTTGGSNASTSYGGIISGTGGVSKAGTGTFTVTGTNTYTGATVIDGGMLAVSATGSIASGSAVAVNNGGTLAGTGNVNGSVTVNNGGTLSPGNSPGLQTLGSLVLNNGGNYNWQVLNAAGAAGIGYDSYTLTGALDLSNLTGATDFNVNLWSLASIGPDVNGNASGFNNAVSQSWTLVATNSAITGFNQSFFTVNVAASNGAGGFSNALAGGAFSLSLGDGGTDLMLNFTAVPEPATWALLVGAGTFLMVMRRRRN